MSRARHPSFRTVPPSVVAHVELEREVDRLRRQLEATQKMMADVTERLAQVEAQQRAATGGVPQQQTPGDAQSGMGEASTSASHMPDSAVHNGTNEECQGWHGGRRAVIFFVFSYFFINNIFCKIKYFFN